MEPFTIAILTGLCTAVFSGVVTLVTDYIKDRRAARRERQRQATEQGEIKKTAAPRERNCKKEEIISKLAERCKEIFKRLGRKPVHTTPYEAIIVGDVVNPKDIDVEFGSIGGLKSIKDKLYELVLLPLLKPDLFKTGSLHGPPKGILLHGPPGTGKTMLAKAIASNAVLINLKVSTLMGKGDDGLKLVAAVFSLANKLQPAIIFIDEVDSFLSKRRSTDHQTINSMKTEFMTLWNGFTTDRKARVLVLGATSRPEKLDEAVLRRFTNTFEIGKPDKSDRAEILQVILKNIKTYSIDFSNVVSKYHGFSGRDIDEVCRQAVNAYGEPLTQTKLKKAFAEFAKSKYPTL